MVKRAEPLRILYQLPSLETIYAYRTIFHGFQSAFEDMGHSFRALTADDPFEQTLSDFKPDILITATHSYYLKFLDLRVLREFRKKGLVVFAKVDFWNSPMSRLRVNEAPSLKNEKEKVQLMKSGDLADHFFHVTEAGDRRMDGFEQTVGRPVHTIPLAADQTRLFFDSREEYRADLSYIGTNLPQKRKAFRERLFPLKRNYNLKLYGQDWSWKERWLGRFQKLGQYYNIRALRGIQKPKLSLDDERRIYSSTKINLNIHEDYQREYGGDVNERLFKIPLCGGFQITDQVDCISKYFQSDEIVVTKTTRDWFEGIEYFMNRPNEREEYARRGRERILSDHTYHERVGRFIRIYQAHLSGELQREGKGQKKGRTFGTVQATAEN